MSVCGKIAYSVFIRNVIEITHPRTDTIMMHQKIEGVTLNIECLLLKYRFEYTFKTNYLLCWQVR